MGEPEQHNWYSGYVMRWTTEETWWDSRKGNRLISPPRCPGWLWDPPSLLQWVAEALYFRVQPPRCEADNSHPSSAVMKTAWTYIYIPTTHLYVGHKTQIYPSCFTYEVTQVAWRPGSVSLWKWTEKPFHQPGTEPQPASHLVHCQVTILTEYPAPN